MRKIKLNADEILFKKCTEENIAEICDLQETAFKYMENTDILRRNSREMLFSCLLEPHYTLGAFYMGKLIAFAVFYDGGKTDENIGRDIEIETSQLDYVANMKLIIVSPEYRGNGLQRLLMCKIEEYAKSKGKKILCGTVSPDNVYSCKNFELMGYKYHSTKIKYSNLTRNIYFKEI